jgi:hypothetical protein
MKKNYEHGRSEEKRRDGWNGRMVVERKVVEARRFRVEDTKFCSVGGRG